MFYSVNALLTLSRLLKVKNFYEKDIWNCISIVSLLVIAVLIATTGPVNDVQDQSVILSYLFFFMFFFKVGKEQTLKLFKYLV